MITHHHLYFGPKMAAARLRWAVNSSSWTPSEQEWVRALSVIQSEERKRVGQFAYQRDAKFALVGRVLIWAGLCEHVGGAEKLGRYRLTRNERGKPLLVDEMSCEDKAMSFNVSHQGDHVVLATEQESSVGVDVMQLSQPRGTSLQQFFHTMRRQFTEKEWFQITPTSTTSEKQQLSNFYRFWSLKESFIKAEGSGLSYGLQNLEFIGSSKWPPSVADCCEDSQLYIRGELARDWKFQECMLDSQHCVTVAVHVGRSASQQGFPPPTFSMLTVQCLLSKLEGLQRSGSSLLSEWQLYKQKQPHP